MKNNMKNNMECSEPDGNRMIQVNESGKVISAHQLLLDVLEQCPFCGEEPSI